MKAYQSLSELLIDFRQINNMPQAELAGVLDVDIRTVMRWENGETLIKPEKERDFVTILKIPHQVIRNLNTDYPIKVYYDIRRRTYSLSAMMIKAENAAWYKSDLPTEDDRIHLIANDSDVEFITDIQKMNNNLKPIKSEVVQEASRLLPELNLVLHDQSGYYAGHIAVFPLKYSSYRKIREREILESALTTADFATHLDESPRVFYFYSLYADSLANAYNLINRLLLFFKEKKFSNYLFAGITFRENKIDYLKQIGLRTIWEDKNEEDGGLQGTLMEGDLDMFLFGKTS